MGRWKALVPLGMAQFLVVLDTSVMNVSISRLERLGRRPRKSADKAAAGAAVRGG